MGNSYRPPSNNGHQSSQYEQYLQQQQQYQQYQTPIPPLSYPSRGGRGFSQTSPHKATPATFTSGIRPSRSLINSGIRHREEDNLMAAFQSGYVAPPAPTFAYGR